MKARSLDIVRLAAIRAEQLGVDMTDPGFMALFSADSASGIKAALDNPIKAHGLRAENLFEAMVVSLGGCKMIKEEDSGPFHAPDIDCTAPDFRLVLDDGEQWLVEVKNVYCENPLEQAKSFKADYIAKLEAYADLVQTPLKIAIYWARWGIWTLVSPDRFKRADGAVDITMIEAVPFSELGRVGDRSIATMPPLRIFVEACADKPRGIDAEGRAAFTVGSVRVFSEDRELTSPTERTLALILMEYGEWRTEEPSPVFADGVLQGVELVASPEEMSGQGLETIGWASRIFSRYHAAQTVKEGKVVNLRARPKPEWFAPLMTWDFRASALPLWLFEIKAR